MHDPRYGWSEQDQRLLDQVIANDLEFWKELREELAEVFNEDESAS